ncbi:dCMP deaminase [Cladophialophora psammophila CBS 110553]|uniref:Deoxycytidylate deaminase n=1 Tax=Cladophialophora psammophila CBS 110553 TaxID=1182543 RepID=W9X7J9_9EURO|nr:dCMP deaminase [Cladophialophora psammophila CBS 110553]EXJ76442.1 dCMP deaminase [Cladophialophora psammophila CBS 110553]
MLIGICGSICSGKHTTAEYLVQHHGFLRLHLPTPAQFQPSSPPSPWPWTSLPVSDHSPDYLRLLPSITDQIGTRGLSFPDVESLLDFVTKRWREHWVLTDIYDEATLEILLRRPFFLLVNVDAPVGTRFERFNERCQTRKLAPMSLTDFVFYNDLKLYGSRAGADSFSSSDSQRSAATTNAAVEDDPTQNHSSPRTALLPLLSHAHLSILNSFPSISAYHAFLATLDLPSPLRLRPTWDAYFMTLAHLASHRSNCMKRRVGCVLVHNARIISTGYNGTPRGLVNCNEGGCPRCNGSGNSGGIALSTCLCLHAEENALLEAGRERIREGAVLYCDTCPCLTCSVKIAQVGVKEVVYSQTYNMDEASRKVLREAGVVLRQFVPKRSGLVGFDLTGTDELGNDLGGSGGRDGREMVVLNGKKP